MLFYRLILLSWLIGNNILNGYLLQPRQRLGSPQTQRLGPLQTQRLGPLQTQRLRSPLQVGQKRAGNAFDKSTTAQTLTTRLQHPRYANAPPNHVLGHSRSLMTQVIQSSMRHRGDHPRKFIDFLDNGAQWHHFISKPKGHKQELRINEGNYHVNLKYGNHDIQEQDDRRNRNPDMYIGETISGENSLSKFTAPPVYDEEAANYQRKTRLDLNYEADTPEAAATEKQNTEQFVNRLHSLMTPLGGLAAPYDFSKGRGKKESYKLTQNTKDEESLMEHDDDDEGPPVDFMRRLPPIEAKADRKGLPEYHGQKLHKKADMSGLQGDGTMDIINKYGLSEEFKKEKEDDFRYHHEDDDGQENDDENKANRKEQVDDRDNNSNNGKVAKDAPYDRDNQERYDTRESSHWSSEDNAKHPDEEVNNIERDYEDQKKDQQGNEDDD